MAAYLSDVLFSQEKGLRGQNHSRKMNPLGRLWRWERLIDSIKVNPNTKMLKKYTKYVATAFAVASLSIIIIGCGGEGDGDAEVPYEMPDDGDGGAPTNNSEDMPAPTPNPTG